MERLSFRYRRRPPGHNAIAAVDRSITLVGVSAAATAIPGGGVDLVARTVAC